MEAHANISTIAVLSNGDIGIGTSGGSVLLFSEHEERKADTDSELTLQLDVEPSKVSEEVIRILKGIVLSFC